MTYKVYPSRVFAEDALGAIDKALNHPTKGVNVGAGPHADVPAVFAPGAVGWTATECSADEAPDGTILVTLTGRASALGKLAVTVAGKLVQLDLTADVVTERPVKFAPLEPTSQEEIAEPAMK